MPADVITALHRLCYAVAAEEVLRRLEVLRQACKANFDPNQPRVPAGNSDGGQWTDTGSSTGIGTGRNDPLIMSDAMPDDEWKPGAQYAANRRRDDPRAGPTACAKRKRVERSPYSRFQFGYLFA